MSYSTEYNLSLKSHKHIMTNEYAVLYTFGN